MAIVKNVCVGVILFHKYNIKIRKLQIISKV